VLGDAHTVHRRRTRFHRSSDVGIAMANQYDTRSEKLLQDADVALYATKDAGGNDYTFFEPRLGKAYVDRLGLQAELSMALDNGELFIEYQPVVELESGRTVGVEALLRGVIPVAEYSKPVTFSKSPTTPPSRSRSVPGSWARPCSSFVDGGNGSRRRLTCGQRSMSRRGSSPAAISSAPFQSHRRERPRTRVVAHRADGKRGDRPRRMVHARPDRAEEAGGKARESTTSARATRRSHT